MIGNAGNRGATAISCCARSRCAHSGVRWPAPARGSSSARAAFSRKWVANNAERAELVDDELLDLVGIGPTARTSAAAPRRRRTAARCRRRSTTAATSIAAAIREPRLEHERPRRVHARAERRQDADAQVAELVAEHARS